MIRIVGIILIMFSSTLFGVYYANLDIFRMKDLKEMKKALVILMSEIEYSLTPLPQASLNISYKVSEPISGIFKSFSSLLVEKKEEEIGTLFESSFLKYKNNLYFHKEDLDYLYSLGQTLGYLDKDLQFNSISLTMKYIDDKIEELGERSLKNKKLYHSLGILGGLILVIVLI